ncbi:MAG: hypothetical protein NC548_45050 [Lachnospiraceae bacterium]|nr:hypothetical protein [Lachnospiraceae bacterium]
MYYIHTGQEVPKDLEERLLKTKKLRARRAELIGTLRLRDEIKIWFIERKLEKMSPKKKAPKTKITPEEIKWQINEMSKMDIITVLDGDWVNEKIPVTQFKSHNEYRRGKYKAQKLLEKMQPVPEPLRTKLILEAKNVHKQEKMNKKKLSIKELAIPITEEEIAKSNEIYKLLDELGIEMCID